MGKRKARSKRQSDSDADSDAARIGKEEEEGICESTTTISSQNRIQRNKVAASDAPVGDSEQQSEKKASPAVPCSLPTPTPAPTPTMAATRAMPLLICSVGNPGSTFSNTLHSAGHTVMKKLSERLEFQPYQKSRPLGNGLVSKPLAPTDSDWTLWQSTSLMNVSGKGVKTAHNTWSQDKPDGEGKLVIVHDELEKPLGAVNLNVRQGASAKGHNGLKSIMYSIGNVPFVRIGIGIGRPVSRESKDVANYVMRKMTPLEKAKIEGSVEEVIAKLKELESG